MRIRNLEDEVTKREKRKGLRYRVHKSLQIGQIPSTNYDYARSEFETGRMKNGGN